MKYMQNGGFQNKPLMKLTLYFTLVFLIGLWISNFILYFGKMGLTSSSVVAYYLGSDADFTVARTFGAMLEVTHFHLPMMAIVILMLTHLIIFAPFKDKTKVLIISASFLSALINEAAGYLVRFGSPHFAPLKILSFLTFQALLIFLIGTLGLFLWTSKSKGRQSKRRSSKSH